MRSRARDAKQQANQWVDKGKEVLNQQKEQFRSAYEAGRQAYHETTSAESSETQNL
jgi:phosphodiesterase/alkaline phosphatase D-like protein